jgi:ATP-binding cassette subfamily B protein
MTVPPNGATWRRGSKAGPVAAWTTLRWNPTALPGDLLDEESMALIDKLIDPEDRALYRRVIMENATAHWRGYAISMGLLLMVSGSTAAMAWIMRDVINGLFVDKDLGAIRLIAMMVVGIFLIRGIATFGNAVILTKIGNHIIAALQKRLFDHLLRQDARFYDRFSLGDVYVRFGGGVSSIRSMIELLILSLGRDIVSLTSLVAVMMIQNPVLSLISVLIAPPAILGVGWLSRRVKALTRESIHAGARIMDRVREVYQGARVVKAFTLEDHIGGKMHEQILHVRSLANQTVRYSTLTVPMMDILGGAAIGSVIAFAGWRMTEGAADPGAFVSFLTALLLAYEPARRLARLKVQLDAQSVNIKLMYGFLDEPATEVDLGRRTGVDLSAGAEGAAIRLRDVQFAYGDRPALNGLTLDAPGGKVTALVGASGAGKTTVFEMLTRFRIPDSGTITLGGHAIEDLGLADLRSNIALVGQQTFLFSGSIHENIRMGRLDATDAEIEEAARAANAHEFIIDRPGGYENVITDESGLSGGERQRVAIARAMLRSAPILLLDEATSALDAESEARVQEALARLMVGRTTLVIAHRLATIRNADVIHVMDAGQVVESGTHDELLTRGGFYTKLHDLQFGKAETAEDV